WSTRRGSTSRSSSRCAAPPASFRRCSPPPSVTTSTSPTSRSPSRRSRPSSSTSLERICANEGSLRMTAITADAAHEPIVPQRRPAAPTGVAFRALLLRDATVLRKTLNEFIPRTLLQPFLLVFVFTYVFPKIGQGVGGSGAGESEFSTILVAGVVALAIMFQGIQTVALPMVQEFGYTREIEDRVLAPLPIPLVAIQKAVWGALASALSALLVFPIAAVVPATSVHLDVDWPVLLTLMPLCCYMCGALGLTFGTRFDPRTVPLLFGIIVIPITFLGCVYYPW